MTEGVNVSDSVDINIDSTKLEYLGYQTISFHMDPDICLIIDNEHASITETDKDIQFLWGRDNSV